MADKRWTGFPFGQGSVPSRAPTLVGVPGALEAGWDTVLFWLTLALSLGVAFVFTVPVNRELLRRGKGHAAVHRIHEARGRGTGPPSGMNSGDRSEAAILHK
ncbi:MAG: DUF4396 domain-containing protein [Chloroflexi bacterium]|nr:MAG: DUF4396 domain-containing protein [Chloroflexota bacterium]